MFYFATRLASDVVKRAPLALVVLLAVAVACSSDDDTSDAEENNPAVTTSSTINIPTTTTTTASPVTSSPTTSSVTTAPPTSTTSTTAAQVVFQVDVKEGVVTGPGRVSVVLDQMVALIVTADVEDEVHLNGYNVNADVGPDTAAFIEFQADVPGIFEVELEDASLLLMEIEVS